MKTKIQNIRVARALWLYRVLSFSVFSCLFVAISSSLSAAPPAVDLLFPAGGARGAKVAVTASGTFDKWPPKTWVSGEGVTVTPDKAKGSLTFQIAADAVPGVRFMRLYNDDGASSLRPFIVGTLPEAIEKEPNDSPATAQKLDHAAIVVNGKLDKTADVDCFALSLRQGQTLVAAVEANRTLKSPMDGILQIVSPDGFILAENNDHDLLDPLIAYQVPKDGTYVVRLFAFPATPDSGIKLASGEGYVYRLTLTTGGFAEFATPLAVSRSAPGSVAANGWSIPAAATAIPVTVAGDGDVATLYHKDVANPITVRLEPHETLDFTKQPIPTTPLKPPFSATARIDSPGGVSKFMISGVRKQPLSIQIESRALGLPLTPLIRVLEESGTQLLRGEPAKLNADTSLTLNPAADANYTIEVRELTGGGGPRFAYLLRVVPAMPDYSLTLAADRLYVVPGKPLDVKVALVRQIGFKDDVVVSAEDLPAGVKCETVPPMGKPDPASVMLRFSAEKPTAGGSFRVVGKVKDKTALTRVARANVAALGDTTADLWVTATDAPAPPPPPKKKK